METKGLQTNQNMVLSRESLKKKKQLIVINKQSNASNDKSVINLLLECLYLSLFRI